MQSNESSYLGSTTISHVGVVDVIGIVPEDNLRLLLGVRTAVDALQELRVVDESSHRDDKVLDGLAVVLNGLLDLCHGILGHERVAVKGKDPASVDLCLSVVDGDIPTAVLDVHDERII